MRYIEPEMEEPTYNRFQVIAGIITSVAIVGVIFFGTLSLISAL